MQQTLAEQARRNELVLAYLRVAAYALVTFFDWLTYAGLQAEIQVSIAVPAMSTTALLAATILMVALRSGWHRDEIRFVVPLAEGCLVFAMFFNAEHAIGLEAFRSTQALAVVAAATTIYALSGALRFHIASIAITTTLGAVCFGYWAYQLAPWIPASIALSVVIAIGALGFVFTTIVERAVRAEVANTTLRRFLPAHVVEDAHADPERLLTEPRTVEATVLVTDVRGFTGWAEGRPPAEVLGFLNELQGGLAEIVREHRGMVDKFLGDGMLAVFGAPEPLDDHADRAVSAARAMLRFVDRSSAERARRGDAPIAIGIGIQTGELVAGCLGQGLRLEFTIIGDTVNTASRLESMTKQRGVPLLIGAATQRRLADPGALTSLGSVPVRGRDEEVEIFTTS